LPPPHATAGTPLPLDSGGSGADTAAGSPDGGRRLGGAAAELLTASNPAADADVAAIASAESVVADSTDEDSRPGSARPPVPADVYRISSAGTRELATHELAPDMRGSGALSRFEDMLAVLESELREANSKARIDIRVRVCVCARAYIQTLAQTHHKHTHMYTQAHPNTHEFMLAHSPTRKQNARIPSLTLTYTHTFTHSLRGRR
jgi:hypothetical protein